MSGQNILDGGEAVIRAFRALDMDYVMASPGSEWGPVWEAFARQDIANMKGPKYLSCAHELTAVDLAIGYTCYTGRMQGVMLHAGVGLLQGSMGIEASKRMLVPMLIVSGEALTFGEEDGYDPGQQWQSSLSVAAGMDRLVEPITKLSQQASSTATLYQQLITAGELAQRTPKGPIYMNVPIKTMRMPWTPPDVDRDIPRAPQIVAADSEIEAIAALIAKAKNPVILTEDAGRDPATHAALIAFAELIGAAVVEGGASQYANFPKDHPLHLGHGRPAFIQDADLIFTIRCRAPWYPPTHRPAGATVVCIDETPFRPHFAFSANVADRFLEGDVAPTLARLCEAVRAAGIDTGAVAERTGTWTKAHDKVTAERKKIEEDALAESAITPIGAFAAIKNAAPDDAIFVEEVVTHRGLALEHLIDGRVQSYYRALGGLGQSLGVSLGVKLAAGDKAVITVVGDGSFLYNPVVQSLALAKHENLPHMIVVMNNMGYEAMKGDHKSYYPDGVAAQHDMFYGRPITDFDYAELAKPFDGFGATVDDMAGLQAALDQGVKAISDGKLALIDAKVTK